MIFRGECETGRLSLSAYVIDENDKRALMEG